MTEDFCANKDILHMSDTTFKTLGGFIHAELGIKMPLSKKQMVESRLKKRLIHLNIEIPLFGHSGNSRFSIPVIRSGTIPPLLNLSLDLTFRFP